MAVFFENRCQLLTLSTIRECINRFPNVQKIWIDLPIGLSSRNMRRDVDFFARKYLPQGYKSSLFTPPCREALQAKSYQQACEINQDICDTRISLQTWNISPKILEVDQWLQHGISANDLFVEAHPEICFYFLNKKKTLLAKKKTPQGRMERLDILRYYNSSIIREYERICNNTFRKDVHYDDILDALALGMSAVRSLQEGHKVIHGQNKMDELGIRMGMHYYDPND